MTSANPHEELATPSRYRITTLLFNPFHYVAGGKALLIGLAVILFIGWLGSLKNIHFNGVLSLHVLHLTFPLWAFLAEGVIAWVSMAVLLLIAGKIFSKTSFRAIDVFGTQALARWPSLFTGLLLFVSADALMRLGDRKVQQIRHPEAAIDSSVMDIVVVVLVVIVGISLVCWMVYLMYKGYSVSCNIKGGRAIGTFIVALILAELLAQGGFQGLMAVTQQHITPPAMTASQTAAPAMESLQQSGEQFVDLLVREDFDAAVAQFHPVMKKGLSEPALRKAWRDLMTQCGPYQKQLGSRTATQGDYRVAFVTCQFERATVDVKIVFDANDQITGLWFQ
ncbi:MAG: DUF3887 domain-containing protein [Phycisphaerae bacterium]|nr:DUF3887 domain-containing protein [Phycisphaerae bacterium]